MSVTFDANLLTSIYQTRAGITSASGGAAGGLAAPTKRVAPSAPWLAAVQPDMSVAVKAALSGRKLINESAAQLDLPGASQDYRKLFALYQGLSTLDAIAVQSQAKNLSTGDKTRLQAAFTRGMTEVAAYIPQADLEKLRLIQGGTALSAKTASPVVKTKPDYLTPPLVSGSAANVVDAFSGAVEFNIKVKRLSQTVDVNINLSQMGATPRSLVNVTAFINQKLVDAGVELRVASERIPGKPKTTEVGGKTVTIGPAVDQFALKLKIGSGETVSFSAPQTAGAIYVAQDIGNPDPDGKASTNDSRVQRQLLKFQTDNVSVPPPLQPPGEANWVDGRLFAQTLGPEVAAVRATKTAADGSVYVLADVTNKSAGQDIKGTQDVALLKYDPAGKLVFSRTLGAADEASGLGLAISADGKIAVAGSVKGTLSGAADGPLNSGDTGAFAGKADSFVTLYDADGQEQWTARRGARAEDEASQVAFAADGSVYVSGRAKSVMPGATAVGDWDNYIERFTTDPVTGKPVNQFTQSYGTTGSDRPAGLVVDGNSIVTASVEGGRAILRRFDVSGASPVLTSTRDLGDLQGDIAGLALDGTDVVIAGYTTNGALNAGTVTKALSGGTDAFVARISADLSPGGSLAYYGGAGDDRATSLAVAGGQVYIGGSSDADIAGEPKIGTKDGFLARIDVGAGTVGWQQRFSGKDGRAAPTSIAVDPTGASVLDRIGLPKGEVETTDSQRLVDVSSLRAGDTFTVKAGFGRGQTVTIEAKDTLDTLAQKIRRASGFQAKVTIGTTDGIRRLTITPISDRALVEFGPGKGDKDALETLGIEQGVVRKTNFVDGKTVAADGKGPLYGLGLDSKLNLDNAEEYNHARADLQTAMGVIRTAYKDLVAAASPRSAQAAQAAANGPAPAYLTAQLANYQAALARLGG